MTTPRNALKEDIHKDAEVYDDDINELPEDRPGGEMIYFTCLWFLGSTCPTSDCESVL